MPPLIMGRDTPLYACLEPHDKFADGYKMAGDLRTMYETDDDLQQGHRRRQGARGPAPPGRHPRRRGGDHQGPAHRLPAHPAQAHGRPGHRGRPGRHPVRDGRRRGARPAQDGLPGPAEPRRHLRRARADQGVPRQSTSTSTTSRSTTPRPSRCSAGATPSACSSWRAAPCAPSCARWPPTASRTSPPSSPCTGPGPMSVNMHNDYADRKNGRKPVEYFHPDAEELLGRHLRPDDLPGVGDAGEPEVRRLLAGRGRQPPQGLRQEEARAHGQGARQVRRRLRDHRLRRSARHPRCSTSSRASPTTPSTRATASATAWSRSRPPTSRPTTRWSTWRPCSPA